VEMVFTRTNAGNNGEEWRSVIAMRIKRAAYEFLNFESAVDTHPNQIK
jgi:hypothetical protein